MSVAVAVEVGMGILVAVGIGVSVAVGMGALVAVAATRAIVGVGVVLLLPPKIAMPLARMATSANPAKPIAHQGGRRIGADGASGALVRVAGTVVDREPLVGVKRSVGV